MSEPLGEYPTRDGDVTDIGRRQQITVAVWVLGWLGGPVPALVALLVTQPPRGPWRRSWFAAAGFWAVMAALGVVLVAWTADEAAMLAVAWVGFGLVALVVPAIAIRRALRRSS